MVASGEDEFFYRWPITKAQRRRIVDALMDQVERGSPAHKIRAARCLLELDMANVAAMDRVDVEMIRDLIEKRKREQNANPN
jgi:hypothetical protein